MYTQYFFKFPSQEEMRQILAVEEVGWWGQIGVSNGEPVYDFTLCCHDGAIDEVGLVVDQPAVYDDMTFEEITPATYFDGWHLNAVLKCPLPTALEAYIVTPKHPSRVFAGFEVISE